MALTRLAFLALGTSFFGCGIDVGSGFVGEAASIGPSSNGDGGNDAGNPGDSTGSASGSGSLSGSDSTSDTTAASTGDGSHSGSTGSTGEGSASDASASGTSTGGATTESETSDTGEETSAGMTTGGTEPPSACCGAQAEAGCEDSATEQCVCAGDPYCCNTEWDITCASEAIECGLDCSSYKGDCCSAQLTPGCNDDFVEACACLIVSSCCNDAWSNGCVLTASTLCGAAC